MDYLDPWVICFHIPDLDNASVGKYDVMLDFSNGYGIFCCL